MLASPENLPLLAELLADQQRLQTPVAKFADANAVGTPPSLEPLYRDLIPLSAPGAGEQYAFEVELDACTGCKACVSACHSLNGLDETETWRDVGLVVGGDERHPFQQTVTTACHHCADPACLNGCPVLAYEKDPQTGIVRHLDDQCIGCQYCILKCPYDVPKYNARLGIVRKCDMCHGRLAVGEAPACVQACPTHAIRIVTLSAEGIAAEDKSERPATSSAVAEIGTGKASRTESAEFSCLFRVAADPNYTRPVTRYLSTRALPRDLHPADEAVLRPQPPHWPLAIMLTLLPMAVGCQIEAAALQLGRPAGDGWIGLDQILAATNALSLVGWLAGAAGLTASVVHLGQPLRAWRIFLGWRRSWLSREAMVFGAWSVAASIALVRPAWLPLSATLAGAGWLCSAMIYVDTRRAGWRIAQTVPRFFGSAAALGAAAGFSCGIEPIPNAIALLAAIAVKLAFEIRALRPASENDDDAPITGKLLVARLLSGPLYPIFGVRVVIALGAGLFLPAMVVAGVLPPATRWAVLLLVVTGELLDRHLFFRGVDAPKMPGMPR